MKLLKSISKFLMAIIAIATQSCNECKQIACPQDIEIGNCVQTAFPYFEGDTLTFINENNDTLSFICNVKAYVKSDGHDFDMKQVPCCDSYTVNDLIYEFNTSDGDKIGIGTDNAIKDIVRIGVQVDSIKISDYWFMPFNCQDGTGLNLTSVIWAGKEFHDIMLPFENDSLILIAPKSEGIVGFKLGGKEWRKI